MEKKISNSLSRVKNKQSDRDRIAEDIKKYLAEGGTVEKVPVGASGDNEVTKERPSSVRFRPIWTVYKKE